jgi:hypothetical protein
MARQDFHEAMHGFGVGWEEGEKCYGLEVPMGYMIPHLLSEGVCFSYSIAPIP